MGRGATTSGSSDRPSPPSSPASTSSSPPDRGRRHNSAEEHLVPRLGISSDTPATEYTRSPESVESTASGETLRPSNPGTATAAPVPSARAASATINTTTIPRAHMTSESSTAGGRTSQNTGPFLRRQPSAASTLHQQQQQQQRQQPQRRLSINTSIPYDHDPSSPPASPRLRRRPESRQDHEDQPIDSNARPGRRNSHHPQLRAPLKRLSSYSHHQSAYSSDEDSDSAADADKEAVQAELERSWEGHPGSTGSVRHRRRTSLGTASRGKGSQRAAQSRYDVDSYDTGTSRRSQPNFYPRDSDIDENSEDENAEDRPLSRPHSRVHRHQHDGQDDSTSDTTDSEASYTLKDRQDAINLTHPFGLKIWKPALYKKSRSVQRTAEGEIHSRPGQWPDNKIRIGNLLWTLIFGWWMCIVCALTGLVILLSACWSGGQPYAFVLFGLAKYLFYPFGRFVELIPDEAYAEEDQGEGTSISEYERYGAVDLERGRQLGILSTSPRTERRRGLIGRQRGHSMGSWVDYSEQDSLLGGDPSHNPRRNEDSGPGRKRRLFGRGQWSLGRIIFFITFYLIIGPVLLLVCAVCWLIVFALPMAKVTSILVSHLRRHPLSMTFHSDIRTAVSRRPATPSAQVLLCTYRAWGWEYYKYTVGGTNIFFVNLVFVVFFTIADEYFLAPLFHHQGWLVHPALIFNLALASIVPLAYFIGMAVASISAQSSMGMGATINAFFGSLVEVFLYSVALTQGKSRLVEGSIVGSIFGGILLMPGVSMLVGALKRKTQRFNAKSAGVTSTMLLFSVIGAFAPTLFYQIYGTSELRCQMCEGHRHVGSETCQRCYWDQANALTDQFYLSSVKPFSYMCSVFLVTSYLVGLWFSLRTHAAIIWETPVSSTGYGPQHVASLSNWRRNIPDERFLKRIGERINTGLLSGGQPPSPVTDHANDGHGNAKRAQSTSDASRMSTLSPEDSAAFVRNVAEVAAAAATLAVRHCQTPPPQGPPHTHTDAPTEDPKDQDQQNVHPRLTPHVSADWDTDPEPKLGLVGHDAPNWSRTKSSIILLSATILYAIIAEILVDTVDVVLGSGSIDEKFLGFTLFALVPNTTEFLNAISFALNGNIALSMEIGSAYALQVCLLQIPALVAVSAVLNAGKPELQEYTFSLMFPRWDLITVILCVFLLAYMYGEGKSNYFKGSILMLAYGVVLMGGFYTPRFPEEAADVAGLVRTG